MYESPTFSGSPPPYPSEAYERAGAERMTTAGPVLPGNGRAVSDKPIPQEMGRLREAVHIQRKMLEDLAGRLKPVFSDNPQPANEACGGPLDKMAPVCPLADEIRSTASSVHQSNDLIRFLLSRIEI